MMMRLLGIVLLVGGVVCLMVGVNASHSVADRVSNTFTGRFTDGTMWYMLGGGAAALTGVLMLVSGWRRTRG
jgi:hypothetical protein